MPPTTESENVVMFAVCRYRCDGADNMHRAIGEPFLKARRTIFRTNIQSKAVRAMMMNVASKNELIEGIWNLRKKGNESPKGGRRSF